jgi:threonine dehydrogenase-like Zn-dependent dehydrogenase
MRAVVFQDIGSVRVVDVPEPALEDPHDAMVRVTVGAVCGSDLHAYHGTLPMDPGERLGHEAAGVVEQVGAAVSVFEPGDRVVIAFGNACGTCFFCWRGQSSLCASFRNHGFGAAAGGLDGMQAERVRVPNADGNLLAVPDDVDDERAVFAGDVLPTAMHGVQLARVEPGDTVAVIGAGPVGYFVARLALLRGAGRVLALDLNPERLRLAEEAGALPVDVGVSDPKQRVKEATDGRGADAAVEAVGSLAALRSAAQVARRGGTVVGLGVPGDETLELPLRRTWNRAITYRFAGVCPVHGLWDDAMRAIAEGRLDPLNVVSHRMPLEDAPKAYELFDRREATKILLYP